MLKKYEKETGLAQDESLQTRAELKRHDQYHAILTERNKYLEDRVAVVRPREGGQATKTTRGPCTRPVVDSPRSV